MIYVYPNGEVRSSPDASMSDDYFTIDEYVTFDEVVLFDIIHKHFGVTHQCIDVMNTIISGAY